MPTNTQYRYSPAYQEGRIARAEGTRRSHNPYSGTGNQFAMCAWWQGYDDEEITDEEITDEEITDDEKEFLNYVALPTFDAADDDEPDFTLDDLEWSETYPELEDCDWDDED